MPLSQKLSVGALFCTGLVCIVFATVRVVSIGQKTGNDSTPSSSWLVLWAVVEGSIGAYPEHNLPRYPLHERTNILKAVIIGCCPGFAALYRKSRNTQKGSSYNANGYSRQPSGGTGINEIPLKSVVSSNARRVNHHGIYWDDASSSQEELAGKASSPAGIVVTTSVSQENSLKGTAI